MKITSTLYFKYIVVTLFIMMISLVLGLLATNMYYHRVIKERNDSKNVAIVTHMTEYIMTDQPKDLAKYFEMIGDSGYQLYVVNPNGQGAFYGGEYRLKDLDPAIAQSVQQGNIYHGIRDYPRQLFITGFFANDLKNTVGVPFTYNGQSYALFARPNISLLFNEVHIMMGDMLVVILLFSLVAILIASLYLVRPIRALTAATKQIARENYDVDIQISRSDEIGELATSFSKMAMHLKQQDEMRKSLIRNVSHDFQTPLQNISGYANLLKSPEITINNRQQYATIIENETLRLSNLTKQLLLLNSLEQLAHQKTAVNITAQIEQAIVKSQWLIDKEELSVWLQLEEAVIDGDETLLENLWENLISNAIKYNVRGGEISIMLKNLQSTIIVTIADTGIGIAEKHLSKVFQRFYRVDEARQTKGTGLGLAIVKEITGIHGGTVSIDSKINSGTTVTITLPKKVSLD
ncbi:HAMP domain-containing sensor histidine kinase [Solibacillus sp. CAU 1738]|uniref:sensor histidine kinase n=1 Tax=Solibacillus sp. CAU 1738 TaxID=3140363 RepID=UPI0032612E1E